MSNFLNIAQKEVSELPIKVLKTFVRTHAVAGIKAWNTHIKEKERNVNKDLSNAALYASNICRDNKDVKYFMRPT